MDDRRAQLERDYCPPLDPALLYSITSDFDLSDAQALQDVRDTLDVLKSSAQEQDTSAFDPSGTSAPGDVVSPERAESCPEESIVRSEGTDVASASTGVASLNLSSAPSDHDDGASAIPAGAYMESVESSDVSTKLEELKQMFPNAKEYSISYTLKKCDGSFTRAMEELLNYSFLDEARLAGDDVMLANKGIDAFSTEHAGARQRRKAGKRKNKFYSLDEASSSSLPEPMTGKESPWDAGARDIKFVSSRTNTPYNKVASLFHQNGASLAATIQALISLSAKENKPAPDDAVLQAQAFELSKDFPSIEPEQVTGLVRLTHPSTTAAHELAKAMTSRRSPAGRADLIPQYTRPEIDRDGDDGNERNTRPWTAVASTHSPATGRSSHVDPAARAIGYAAESSKAYMQASAAYRRGRSDHLMGAAAGYYSQLGRDYAAKSKEATAEAADALVNAQSGGGVIDLHGVSVKDAVRIAQRKTEEWWRVRRKKAVGVDGRVRAEEAGGAPSSLVIVTGMGRHSKGGKGLIGPAVGRMLMREGWQARCEEGCWIVSGLR